MKKEKLIKIPESKFDRLEACSDLLDQIVSDHDGILEDYFELYPLTVRDAGYAMSEDEEDVS